MALGPPSWDRLRLHATIGASPLFHKNLIKLLHHSRVQCVNALCQRTSLTELPQPLFSAVLQLRAVVMTTAVSDSIQNCCRHFLKRYITRSVIENGVEQSRHVPEIHSLGSHHLATVYARSPACHFHESTRLYDSNIPCWLRNALLVRVIRILHCESSMHLTC